MKKRINTKVKLIPKITWTVLFILLLGGDGHGQEIKGQIEEEKLHQKYYQMIEVIDFKNVDLRNILRGIGIKYNLNLFVDNDINIKTTLHMSDVTILEFLEFISTEYELDLNWTGSIVKIKQKKQIAPQKEVPVIIYDSGNLSVDLENDELTEVVNRLIETTGENIIIQKGAEGTITGKLNRVPFELAFKTLMSNNGFFVHKRNEIYYIRPGYQTKGPGRDSRIFWVEAVNKNDISLEVSNAALNDLLREIFLQLDINLMTYGKVTAEINAKLNNLHINSVLDYILRGTNYTYRKEDDTYFIGDKSVGGLASTQLIKLEHMKSEGIIELLPPALVQRAILKEIKEQNGIIVVASQDVIAEIQNFLQKIDLPSPQILIEALVIDYNLTKLRKMGIEAGFRTVFDTSSIEGGIIYPFVEAIGGKAIVEGELSTSLPGIFVRNIGKLPDSFFFKINALAQEGIANIRSKPHLATLNGNTATLTISTTQYYIFESQTIIPTASQPTTATTQRFEKVEAKVSLEVTPWVSASGEITVEIHPEFSTPVGNFSPDIPPTINSRIIKSTVRLKDGETIILGGLIQSVRSETVRKMPVLGDLPFIGNFFKNVSYEETKSELVIYLTLHLYYPGESNVEIPENIE